MNVAAGFAVRVTDWQHDEATLRTVREAVFIVEQDVPAELEWDAADGVAVHALAVDARGTPIGCARLLPDAQIGRVAVLRDWRGLGVGAALMRCLIGIAETRGQRRLSLHAQVSACDFYARLGFVRDGEIYDEVGIAHQTMVRER